MIQNDENEGGDAEERRPKEEKIFVNPQVAATLGIKIPKALLDKSVAWK